jgi:AcrR family transcriptional regulator
MVVLMNTSTRPLRADAAHNRALLLAAAEEEFAEKGVDATIADIARRAGVAKGTVFRHFATKEDLIGAIIGEHLAALATVARALVDAQDPGTALLDFLVVAADQQQQRDLAFLQAVVGNDPMVTRLREQLYVALEQLVDRARRSGDVRSDITATDVWVLLCAPIHAVAYLSNPGPDTWRRYVALIFDALRPEGVRPLPEPAPDWP